jgi:O-antigen ligase
VAVAKRPLQGYGFGAGRFVISYDGDTMESFLDGDTTSRMAVALRRAHESKYLLDVQPHNDHIERLVELGLPGYFCFAAMWCCLLMCIPKLVRAGPGPIPDFGRCVLATMWFFFVDSLLHSMMFAVGGGIQVMNWYLLVVVLVASRTVSQMRSRPNPFGRNPRLGLRANVLTHA